MKIFTIHFVLFFFINDAKNLFSICKLNEKVNYKSALNIKDTCLNNNYFYENFCSFLKTEKLDFESNYEKNKNKTKNSKRKAFVFCLPQTGHVYPLTSVSYYLVNEQNFDVIFYNSIEYKEIIEKTGSEFREYKNFQVSNDKYDYIEWLNIHYSHSKSSNEQVKIILHDIEKEQPDVIIYDFMTLPALTVSKILKNRYRNGNLSNIPLFIKFSQSFALKKNLVTLELIKLILKKPILQKNMIKKYFCLWLSSKIAFYEEEVNFVSVIPELQPKKHFFGDNYIFLGSCILENIRKPKQIDKITEKFLDKYHKNNYMGKKFLIYASLGTLFHNNKIIFDKIIEAFILFERENPFYSYALLIAVGKDCYKQYKNEALFFGKNILLIEHAEQIEVLKKASLFITHCGMNSVSEGIHYGVPMICIPIDLDQILVAHHLEKQLNLIISYNPIDLEPVFLKNGIKKVLNDQSYYQKISEFSQISKIYDGGRNAVKEILKNLDLKNNKRL